MPELPEVETVRNSLKQLVLNETITDVEVFYDKIIKNVDVETFKTSLINQTINDIQRLGKYLIFVLDDYYLISHLRMEGKYYLKDNNEYSKHEHIVFHLGKKTLTYADTRKFGTMNLLSKDIDIYKEIPLNKVGLEPFNENFTLEYLEEKFKNSKRPIKTSLLDQGIVAGLGNIYVDEVLFLSSLNPNKPTNEISKEEIKMIIESSIKVLNKAIKLGGTTIRSFTVNHDISGKFQNELLIHTKKECPTCNRKVVKIYVGGRGTYYCEFCQSLDKEKNL